MDAIKRYWTALDQTSRHALRRAFIIPLVIGTVMIVAAAALYMATVDDIETSADLAREFGMLQALMAATVIAGIYSYFLIYKAHKAIKENLFAHPADGRPTPETWSRKDGVILALALLGVVSIPGAVAGLVAMAALPIDLEPSSFTPLIWPIIGLALGPYAAKRFIPVEQ